MSSPHERTQKQARLACKHKGHNWVEVGSASIFFFFLPYSVEWKEIGRVCLAWLRPNFLQLRQSAVSLGEKDNQSLSGG